MPVQLPACKRLKVSLKQRLMRSMFRSPLTGVDVYLGAALQRLAKALHHRLHSRLELPRRDKQSVPRRYSVP